MDNIRMRKLIVAVDEWFSSFSYYDEDTDDNVIDGTEEECYNSIMQDDELHLLTTATVKEVISTAFKDWEKFVKLQHKYKAYC